MRIYISLIITMLISLTPIILAFTYPNQNEQKATVQQMEGVSIFILSKPISEYEFLGTVKKTGLVWSGKPDEMFNGILKKCKKEFPKANGIIFSDISLEKADCIFLK